MEPEFQDRLEVAENNANLLLKPKFIPVYTELNGKGLSLMDKVLYGFIEFFLSNNEKFYCSNEQLAELLETTPVTISKSIKHLEELGYIVLNKKMKTGGGLIRFITLSEGNNLILQNKVSLFREIKNLNGIYNKNNIQNNIYNENSIPKQEIAVVDEDNGAVGCDEKMSFEDIWNNYYCIPVRKGDKKEAEKEYNKLTNKEGLYFEECLIKYEYKYKILDIQYCKKCSNWLKNYSPQDEDLQRDRLLNILKIHKQQKETADEKEKIKLKKNYEEMKKDFGEEFIKDLYKQAKIGKINIKTF